MNLPPFYKLLFFSALPILNGCGGYYGAVAGAGLSGYVTGAALKYEPAYWPFEENYRIMVLDCEGVQTEVEISPTSAIVSKSGEKLKFDRDYSAESQSRLRYFHMILIEPTEQDQIVNEKSMEDFIVHWLVVLDEGNAELEMNGVFIACLGTEQEM